MIEIRPVSNRHLLRQFIKVPWTVYRNDPLWIPPLLFERLRALAPTEPIFQHLDWQGWVAYREGVPVGRISAQVDSLHLRHNHPGEGFFGMIEGLDEPLLFENLTATAEAWLRERGMTSVLGPLNLNINQEPGLLCDGYDSPQNFLMGHAHPYYHRHLEAAGYRRHKELLAYRMHIDAQEPASVRRLHRRLGDRLLLRRLNRADKAAELEVLRQIFNDGWSDNWGFVPFTAAEFKALGKTLLYVVPPEFIRIAELDGKAAGFIVVLPNINECIKDLDGRLFPTGWIKLLWRLKVRFPKTVRIPLMGVRRDLHNSFLAPGVATALIQSVRAPTIQRNVDSCELSWILEDNTAMRGIIERLGGTVGKRYRLYRKGLANS